jgi:hypothetical protein
MQDKLIVLGRSPSTSKNIRRVVKCFCGNIKTMTTGNFFRAKSCGCMAGKNQKHGMKGTPTYNCWNGLIQRATNPNNNDWKDYGGRGIGVCERWLSFENFYTDMGEKPLGTQIDRIDNNKGYSPDNCRWLTPQRNCSNRRNNIRADLGFFPLTLAELARLGCVSSSTASLRWAKYRNPALVLFPQ